MEHLLRYRKLPTRFKEQDHIKYHLDKHPNEVQIKKRLELSSAFPSDSEVILFEQEGVSDRWCSLTEYQNIKDIYNHKN